MCELKILLWSRKFGSVHFTQKQGFDLLSQNSFFGGWGLTEIIVIYCLYYILILFGRGRYVLDDVYYTWDLWKSFWVQVYFWQVIDMDGVLAVITILEAYPITRDVLEVTILKMIWIATYLTITWHQCNCRSMFYGIKLKVLNVLSQ